MPTYWVVVKRTNSALLNVLNESFRDRDGFGVITDRRAGTDRSGRRERPERRAVEQWDGQEVLIAEQQDAYR
jgi:hypothetical protein